MDIIEPPEGDCYRFCMYLYESNEVVDLRTI